MKKEGREIEGERKEPILINHSIFLRPLWLQAIEIKEGDI